MSLTIIHSTTDATTAATATAGNDVNGAAGGIIDRDGGSGFAVEVDGAGVVEELLSVDVGVAATLEFAVRLRDGSDGSQFCISLSARIQGFEFGT